MARSKNNHSDTESDIDSDIDSDSDYQLDLDNDEPPPPTTEDAFNKIFRGATTLPTRIRKKPQPYGTTPSPPNPTLKKKTKKKIAPLVNSNRTNQSNNNGKTKKRPRVKAKVSTKQPSSVAPLSSIATNDQPNAILLNEVSLSTSVPNGALLS